MDPQQQPQQQQVVIAREPKSMGVAYVLWFFLGVFGAHRFYLDRTGSAVAQLSLFVAFWITFWILIGIIPLAILGIWLFADLFLTAGMVREANQRVGVAAGYAAAPQMVVNIGSEFRERAYEEWSREEEKQQRAEEAQRSQEAEARTGAKMLPPMPQQLASVPGIVDLSPDEVEVRL